MSDTSNLYNDMRNLIHFLPFICSGYPWRAIGNTLTVLQHRKYPIIHSLRSENVATDSKNKETIASLFFSRCQRSKVIARVTRNSPAALSSSLRAYLALRGCELLLPLPMVGWFGFAWQPSRYSPDGRMLVRLSCKPSLHLPVVAFVLACPAIWIAGKLP